MRLFWKQSFVNQKEKEEGVEGTYTHIPGIYNIDQKLITQLIHVLSPFNHKIWSVNELHNTHIPHHTHIVYDGAQIDQKRVKRIY